MVEVCVQFCRRNCESTCATNLPKTTFLEANIANKRPTRVKLSLTSTNILHPTLHLFARKHPLDPRLNNKHKTCLFFFMFCLTSAPFIPCSHAALCFWNNTYTIHTCTHWYKLNVSKYWHSPVDATWSAGWGIISQRRNRSLIRRSHVTRAHKKMSRLCLVPNRVYV